MEAISWERLSDYIGRQLPAVIPITGKHGLSLVVGKNARTISLRIPYTGERTGLVSPYREVAYEIASVEGKPVLELVTSSPDLFHAFYLFAVLVAEHIEERGDEVLDAIRRAQHVFGQLLVKRALLSEERQLGLNGELCVLQGILKGWGKSGLSAWVGPAGERHDFRFGNLEIEVKSTTGTTRKHRINGAGQLEPSPRRTLYVLSLQFELAGLGGGHTLPGRVDSVRRLLCADVQLENAFQGYLKQLGYEAENAPLYIQRYQLRSRPALVLVDQECPKITGEELGKALAKSSLSRIGEIEYEIDLSGLGFTEGSKHYSEVLKKVGPLE